MRTSLSPVLIASALLLWAPSGTSQGVTKGPLAKIISEKRTLREEGKKEIRTRRKEVIGELLQIVNDVDLRRENRAAVLAAIELLGELRAKEAVPVLVSLLRFGRTGTIQDRPVRRIPEPPHLRAPAVQALIDIGVPSLGPVTKQLVALTDETEAKYVLQLHCLWVIKGVLGPKLGKAHVNILLKTNKRAQKSKFVAEGPHFMDVFIRPDAQKE